MVSVLPLCVCALYTFIQLMSSQPTHDVIQENDDCNCGRNDEMMTQLMTINSQLQTAVSQLQAALGRTQRDVAEIKAATRCANQQENVKGMPEDIEQPYVRGVLSG